MGVLFSCRIIKIKRQRDRLKIIRVAELEEFCVPFEALSMLIFVYCTGFIFICMIMTFSLAEIKKKKNLFLPKTYKKLS